MRGNTLRKLGLSPDKGCFRHKVKKNLGDEISNQGSDGNEAIVVVRDWLFCLAYFCHNEFGKCRKFTEGGNDNGAGSGCLCQACSGAFDP